MQTLRPVWTVEYACHTLTFFWPKRKHVGNEVHEWE